MVVNLGMIRVIGKSAAADWERAFRRRSLLIDTENLAGLPVTSAFTELEVEPMNHSESLQLV